MEVHQTGQREETKPECFLCALDPHPCTVTQLEGRIINAYEFNVNGEMIPFVTIDTGTSFASLSLTRYYRSLVQGLMNLGNSLRNANLRLRVYHLPPVNNITEHKGRLAHRYRANSYTLAILEPDTVLNITDLNSADYCPRQYLLNRLTSSPMSAAALRGNLVHSSFKELLKEHDRGELMNGHEGNGQETPLATLYRHLDSAMQRSSIDLALANVATEAIREEVSPHLESLATWFQKQRNTLWDMPNDYQNEQTGEEQSENVVRAETFLLAPEIGLKGRLDLLWRQTGRQRLLELKTGGANGELPKSSHKWQVRGYHALLTVRRDSKMKKALATLLYSGTPGEAQAFGIPFTIKELQRVNEVRNTLVLSHLTGIPPAPPGPSRCTKCAMLQQCEQVSSLLHWKPPEPDKLERDPTSTSAAGTGQLPVPAANSLVQLEDFELQSHMAYSTSDSKFFAKYYKLLRLEGREGELQQALLWNTPVTERIERGTAIGDLQALEKPEPTKQGEWEQTFRCKNTSELREGDEILLSEGNPITGEVVTGTIVKIGAEEVRVWTPELITHPKLIDRYDTDIVHVRTLQNLLRWLQVQPHLRALVAGTIRPRFNNSTIIPQPNLNAEQNLAVKRAMQMEDYLLIHGPPGTGKTSVIAEIVKRLCQQGQRVMLAAFTNQAVDNMLWRLESEGFHDYVRLGHERSVAEAVQAHLLQKFSSSATNKTLSLREVLKETPVVASTTATWSSDKYTLPSVNEAGKNGDNSILQFDVAIIDEAGQLTVPAILSALRFAKRFILVGDEKQLPPLVLSKEAKEKGLADSLFAMLKRQDLDYMKFHPAEISACVPLTVQYRMNKYISGFASNTFYEGKLLPHASVGERVLEIATSGSWSTTEAPTITRAIVPSNAMVFLDVRSERAKEGAKFSDAEARTVCEVVRGLLRRGIKPKDIGIIAPYRAQVANVRRHLLSELELWQRQAGTSAVFQSVDAAELSIDTVDRFQGGERKVIIISFATSTTPSAESQLREHLTNSNRLNVALTRAQCKLILVGCAPALAELPSFRELLRYCHRLQTVIRHEPASVSATIR